jgi:hopanoid biosynthesis associated radical SAM protein HpnH
MKISLSMAAKMATYIARNKMSPPSQWQVTVRTAEDPANPFRMYHGQSKSAVERQPHPMINKRFPMVMMLEPLHACNLTCTGCGRIREYESTISQTLTLEQCLAASDECGAPMVSICGGEPMLYPKIGPLTQSLLDRGRQVMLCTNGMFIRKKLGEFRPHQDFYFNVHLDGLRKNHDLAVEREGVFDAAIDGIKAAKAAGFLVVTNTTIYRETEMSELWEMFELLEKLGVDTHQISPAYGYSAVNDREIFMTRDDIREKLRDVNKFSERFKLNHTPAYLDFLRGERELPCTAWGTPTYNIKGWKGPCYVITDAHYATFEELMTKTPWENYGPGADPRCEHCMMHSGFEPSAAMGINTRFTDTFKLLQAALK